MGQNNISRCIDIKVDVIAVVNNAIVIKDVVGVYTSLDGAALQCEPGIVELCHMDNKVPIGSKSEGSLTLVFGMGVQCRLLAADCVELLDVRYGILQQCPLETIGEFVGALRKLIVLAGLVNPVDGKALCTALPVAIALSDGGKVCSELGGVELCSGGLLSSACSLITWNTFWASLPLK